MKETKKKSSGIPVVIIVLVLVVVVAGGFLFYRQSQPAARSSTAPTTSTTAVNQRPPLNMATAPPGAQPPNALGAPTATITIEEFADFQCGSCAAAHPVLKEVNSAYAGNKNVRFVFRHYPLQAHDKAYDAEIGRASCRERG